MCVRVRMELVLVVLFCINWHDALDFCAHAKLLAYLITHNLSCVMCQLSRFTH